MLYAHYLIMCFFKITCIYFNMYINDQFFVSTAFKINVIFTIYQTKYVLNIFVDFLKIK